MFSARCLIIHHSLLSYFFSTVSCHFGSSLQFSSASVPTSQVNSGKNMKSASFFLSCKKIRVASMFVSVICYFFLPRWQRVCTTGKYSPFRTRRCCFATKKRSRFRDTCSSQGVARRACPLFWFLFLPCDRSLKEATLGWLITYGSFCPFFLGNPDMWTHILALGECQEDEGD